MNAVEIVTSHTRSKAKRLVSSPVSYMFDYSVFVQTVRGIKEFKTTQETLNGSKDDIDTLNRIGYDGDIDEVMSVMCTRTSDTTANEHFVIQVITDHPSNNTFRFNIQSENDLTKLSQVDLLEHVNTASLQGDVFHVSCSRLLDIN